MRVLRLGSLRVGVIAVVALAACSDTTSGQPVPQPPSYLALTRIVLQRSDLPTGWSPRPAVTRNADPDVQAKVADCAGVRLRAEQRVHHAASPDYGDGDFTAASTASSFRTEIELRNRLSALEGPKANECLTSVLRSSLSKIVTAGTRVEDVAVRVVKGGAAPNVVATAHAVITVSALGQTARVYSDTAFISGSLFGAEVAFTGIGAQVPTSVQNHITTAIARRAARI